jgi:NADPH-dependent 2,4-dienoyl-CoA reductase/sulfur reductase-like enzyme
MADPDMPKKAERGRTGDIRKCIRCFECFSHAFTHLTHCCAINPEIGFERELRYGEHGAPVKKRVLVVGGGVAGMQAALTCAQRGHRVTLVEKSGELGGALRCERNVPFKQNLQRYLNGQARRVMESGIDLRLRTEATPELCVALSPDVIVAALGSRPIPADFLPGHGGGNVLSAETGLSAHGRRRGKTSSSWAAAFPVWNWPSTSAAWGRGVGAGDGGQAQFLRQRGPLHGGEE